MTKICGERGSNTRPSDLQSDALPTELSPLVDCMREILYIFIINVVVTVTLSQATATK